MNEYAFRRELDKLLEQFGLVAETREVVQARRGLSTAKDRLLIRIVAKEVPK